MAERTGARPRRGGGAPQARFAAAGRADGQDGQWEVVDRQTGTAPVGGKVLPVRRAAAGLNREDREAFWESDYRSTRRGRDPGHPEGASGAELGGSWAWRAA